MKTHKVQKGPLHIALVLAAILRHRLLIVMATRLFQKYAVRLFFFFHRSSVYPITVCQNKRLRYTPVKKLIMFGASCCVQQRFQSSTSFRLAWNLTRCLLDSLIRFWLVCITRLLYHPLGRFHYNSLVIGLPPLSHASRTELFLPSSLHWGDCTERINMPRGTVHPLRQVVQ